MLGNTFLDCLNNSEGIKPGSYGNCTAVSYTHLRAHETKANLVCRLLLEKKKKNKQRTKKKTKQHIPTKYTILQTLNEKQRL